MVGKRGRPAQSNTTTTINDLLVELMSKKENNFVMLISAISK